MGCLAKPLLSLLTNELTVREFIKFYNIPSYIKISQPTGKEPNGSFF